MLKSSGAMAAATMTSRVLGMAREMVYAAFMGNTWVASAFALAFQVPNLFRRLLGEGALTAAFIPIFKQKEVREQIFAQEMSSMKDRERLLEEKFKEGLSKVIDGTVECLNASSWSRTNKQ